eukprot:363635_1
MSSSTYKGPRVHILDRRITPAPPKGSRPPEVSLSAFGFLLCEMVQYNQGRVTSIDALNRRLESLGYVVGIRTLELCSLREKSSKRRKRLLQVLQFVSSDAWRALFGKTADSLERSTENADEYMIHELMPITNIFVSTPVDMRHLDCASYIAGIIAGIMEGSSFTARVTAHAIDLPYPVDGKKTKTVFLVKVDPEVMERERQLG